MLVNFTSAEYWLLILILYPSLEKKPIITFANSNWLVFWCMWCPAIPLSSPGQAEPTLPGSPPKCETAPPHPKGGEGRKREGEEPCTAHCTVSTSTRDPDFWKNEHLMQHNRAGLHTQGAQPQSDTQLSVQRRFPSNAVHSDLLGSFMD